MSKIYEFKVTSNKFVFGSHYLEDGTTWVDDGTGEGIEFVMEEDGRLSVFAITPYYEYGRFLTVEAVARLREFLATGE